MTVVSFPEDHQFAIAEVRIAASEMVTYLRHLQSRTETALQGVGKARTIEKVVMRYARWLGDYHRVSGAIGVELRRIETIRCKPAAEVLEAHRAAAIKVQLYLEPISDLIRQPAVWMVVPNQIGTRRAAEATLTRTIRWLEMALEQCAILSGQSSEGKSS